MGQVDDCLYNSVVLFGLQHVNDKILVDLYLIDREVAEVGERGKAGAEIISAFVNLFSI